MTVRIPLCQALVCALLFPNDKVINVQFIDVVKQDCGLYAIAYATSMSW